MARFNRATGMSEAIERRGGRIEGASLLDGKYRLEAPLATGGMGSVWRARHVTLDRPVAVKFVDVERGSAGVVDRFLREAKVAGAIRHPNVVDILDFGKTESGEPIMVMELLEGESLGERLLAEEPLPTATVVRIASQVLAGLDAVHRAGIVHRDLKPANVFLSADGDGEVFARLLDFGISFSIDPSSEHRRGRFGTDERLVVGTPEYMAPEQAEGRPDIDARADVYSVAVIVYEALSGGVLPYTAEHPGQILAKVIHGGALPLVHLRPDVPEIASVVMRGMAHRREERPESARAFRRLLLDAAGMSPDVTGQHSAPRVSGVRRSVQDRDETPVVVIERDAPTAPHGLAAPPTANVRRGAMAVLLVLLALVVVAVLSSRYLASEVPSSPPPPIAVAPPPAVLIDEAPARAPEPVPLATTPVSEPPVVAPALVAAPAPAAPPHARPGPRAHREAPPAAAPEPAVSEPAPTARGVVHDLDF